jgi:uncharacterized membrane protein YbhN (UPF0104 family)
MERWRDREREMERWRDRERKCVFFTIGFSSFDWYLLCTCFFFLLLTNSNVTCVSYLVLSW